MRKRMPRGHTRTDCSKCGAPLEENRRGKQSYCKSCHAEHMRRTRPKHSALHPVSKKKANARAYLHAYIKRGKMIKKACEVCGDIKVEAHHHDYDKPLEVVWLCKKHHLDLHRKVKN